eukprot:c5844_g1_i3.p1 GENE.c5844_g1_i3~~c5844_g1_i3.p1  ORF type:complete len:123 (+),score=33.55 c5844_g1_i3:295-663(+)
MMSSPVDMMLRLFQTCHEVFDRMQLANNPIETAQPVLPSLLPMQQPPERIMGADQFFPMLLWVCVHARFVAINECLQLMKHFIALEDRITEMGYYVTCLEGAVVFVMQAEHSQLHSLFPLDK